MIDELLTSDRARVALTMATASMVAGIIWWAAKRYFVPRSDCETSRAKDRQEIRDLSASVRDLSKRVEALEKGIAEMPTVEDISELKLAISRVEGGQQAQQAQLTAMNHNLTLIQQHLLERRP